ncbi:hypothetical protein KSF78_0005651 [Schistosoma japonicum]|nr:hypothetical protein KSF78_0005651 [Schistosoma japonicum]
MVTQRDPISGKGNFGDREWDPIDVDFSYQVDQRCTKKENGLCKRNGYSVILIESSKECLFNFEGISVNISGVLDIIPRYWDLIYTAPIRLTAHFA